MDKIWAKQKLETRKGASYYHICQIPNCYTRRSFLKRKKIALVDKKREKKRQKMTKNEHCSGAFRNDLCAFNLHSMYMTSQYLSCIKRSIPCQRNIKFYIQNCHIPR